MKSAGPKGKYFAAVSAIMSFILFVTPILAQQDDLMAGRMAGEQAARASVNGTLWFFAGCCAGLTGVIIAYVYEPSPSSAQLLGKSPEYVAAYTDAYKATAKNVQTGRAITGCVVSAVTYTVLYVALIVAAAAAEEDPWDDPYYY